jgi:tripartite ATP-independent transporter DctP family solute receptor
MHKNNMIKTLALTTTVLFSAGAFSATWKMALGDGGGSTQDVLSEKFVELFDAKTNGENKIERFLNGQLGSEQDTVNDVALNALDFSVLASNNLSPFSPSLGVLSLPYVFESLDDAIKTVKGPIGDELTENTIRDANVRIIGWTFSGFRHLINSKRAIKKISDLDGLVVRVPKNEIMIESYKSWGINPTPMAWNETFSALQQKVVDGTDLPYIAINSMKFGEIQKYLTEIHYLFLLQPMVMSEDLFREQNKTTQQAIVAAGKEATDYSIGYLRDQEISIKKNLVSEYEMQLDTLEDEPTWIKKAQQSVWPKFYKEIGGKEKVNKLLRNLGREEV